MATNKKKSFLDKLVEAATESDDPASAPTKRAETSSSSMAASLTQPTPMPMAPSMASIMPVTPGAAAAPMTEVDPEALQTVKQQVYVQTVGGRASNFILFINMWEALGRPADPNIAVGALRVTNPNMSSQEILSDIDQHLMLLDNTATTAKHAFDSMASQKLGGNDTEIKALSEQNENAVREIERHQAEIAQRTQRLQALQTERADTEAKLTRARQRTTVAEGVVRSELASMKQLLAR